MTRPITNTPGAMLTARTHLTPERPRKRCLTWASAMNGGLRRCAASVLAVMSSAGDLDLAGGESIDVDHERAHRAW